MSQPIEKPLRSDPLRQRVREQTEQTYRSAIVEAAETVFVSQGFQEARMADIAQAAGVSVGTLYNYFANKEAVFGCLMEERRLEFHRVIDQACTEQVEQPALHLITTLLQHIEQHSALMVLFTQLGAVSENDVRRIGGNECQAGYAEYLEQLAGCIARSAHGGELRADIEPRRLASALAGAVNALVFDWLHTGRPSGLSERGVDTYRLFVEGARKQ
jgi:AcrR family transcriptional regulator